MTTRAARHLMSSDPRFSACGGVWWVGSPAADPRCADDLGDVSCKACLRSDAFRGHAVRAAAANRRAIDLLVQQGDEIHALQLQVAALQEAGAGLARKLRKTEPASTATAAMTG